MSYRPNSERVRNTIKDFKYYAIADGLRAVLALTMEPWREPKPPLSHHKCPYSFLDQRG